MENGDDISIYIDQPLLEEIDSIADKKERSRSQQIVYLVKQGMKKEGYING